jgi:hypothetical protein
MESPQVADGGDGLLIGRIVANFGSAVANH